MLLYYIVTGMELGTMEENDEIEEGSDVKLFCVACSDWSQTPTWRFGNKPGRLSEVDEDSPPEGIIAVHY